MNVSRNLCISALALSFTLTILSWSKTSAWAAEAGGTETPQGAHRANGLVARGPFRHVHPLGAGQPQGDGNQLVAGQLQSRGVPNKGPIPVEVYDNLYKEFNPVKFDAASGPPSPRKPA